MFLPEDEQNIIKMTGMAEIPSFIEDEYEKWLRFLHRGAGGAGPLGPVLLISMLRSLKIEPPLSPPEKKFVDFSRVPNGAYVVATLQDENGKEVKRKGSFRGKVDYGTVGVLLEGEDVVREINMRFVDLWRPDVANDLNVTQEDLDKEVDIKREPTTVRVIKKPKPKGKAAPPQVDWSKYKNGHCVKVDLDGDIQEGSYRSYDDGQVLVTVGAEDLSVTEHLVFPKD